MQMMDRLRPLVGLKGWDYCVLWKLSQDQRCIEWVDCCCGGNEKRENKGEELLFPVSPLIPCRDSMSQHPTANSCELLARLPSSMPLDSGIYTQTLLSNEPKWLNFSNTTDSASFEEQVGTRVLVPVPFGLIELFVTKQITEDQQVVDFVTAQCTISMEEEAMMNSSNMDTSFNVNMNPINDIQSNPFLVDHNQVPSETSLENLNMAYDISLDRIRLCSSSPMNFLQQFQYGSDVRSKFPGSFNEGSQEAFLSDKALNPFKSSSDNGFQEMDPFQNSMMTNSSNMHMQLMEQLGNREQQGDDKDLVKHENGRSDSISDCSDQIDDEDDVKYQRRNGQGPQSKNLVAERKRRKKLNDRLYALRALVPKISKLDRASILGDAIEFVKELQRQVKELQNELEENSDEEGAKTTITNNVQQELLSQNGIGHGSKHEHDKVSNGFQMGSRNALKQNQDNESTNDKVQQMEPNVEVAQIDENEFFVKVFCENKRGGFMRLMEALNSLGLEVTNANVTSYRGLVSNVFKVAKKDCEMVQADHVRDSLLEITRNPSRAWPEMAKSSENGCGMDHPHHQQHHFHDHHINSHLHSLHNQP